MRKRRYYRRTIAVLILSMIVLAGGWTAIWYVAAGRVADHVLAWERQQRADGWSITHGPPQRSGWPMAAGVTLPGIRVAGGAQYLPGGIAWQADALTLAVDIRHPNKLFWGVTGRQTLRASAGSAIPFQATTFAGQVALAPDEPSRLLQLHATGLIAAVTASGGTPQPFTVTTLDAAETDDTNADAAGNALVVAATMTGVGLPPHLLPGLGGSLRSLSFDAAVSGPVPAQGSAPAPPALATEALATAWRNAGGTVGLRALHLADGPLTVDGQGRFQLDAFLRPEGSVALHLAGVNETVDRLAETGTLTRPEATAIRAVLGLMMRPAGVDTLDAPLNLRDGILAAGTIPLFRLPL